MYIYNTIILILYKRYKMLQIIYLNITDKLLINYNFSFINVI